MKKIFIPLLLLFGLPLLAFAQNINGRFSSSIYTFQRFDTTDQSNTYIRSYQTLNLNINQGNYSLRSYFNLENDLSKKSDYDPRFRFYNLFFEARNIYDIATIKLGRQPLFNSYAGGIFDGASLDVRYKGYKLSGYYGGNVPAYEKLKVTTDLKNDFILGGKLSAAPIDNLLIGLSYIDKNFKPVDYYAIRLDQNFNPVQRLIEQNSNQFSVGTAEVSYQMPKVFSIDTRYDYDFNYNKTTKVELDGRLENLPVTDLGVTLYYNYREPRINYNSIFSVFNYGNSQEIEGGLDYRLSNMFTVFGKLAYVSYEDDHSNRFTLGVNSNYGSINYRKSLGYEGELDALSLSGAYSFLEGFITPSLGISYTNYKLSKDDPSNSLVALIGGCNLRPWKPLSFDLQGQYMNNKIYKNDFRFFFKLNYWFNTNLNLI